MNFRILPGDSAESVAAYVKRVIADDRIEVKAVAAGFEPSKVSSPDAAAYKLVERTIREVFPDAVVAPGLTLQATDSRQFGAVPLADVVGRARQIWFSRGDRSIRWSRIGDSVN